MMNALYYPVGHNVGFSHNIILLIRLITNSVSRKSSLLGSIKRDSLIEIAPKYKQPTNL